MVMSSSLHHLCTSVQYQEKCSTPGNALEFYLLRTLISGVLLPTWQLKYLFVIWISSVPCVCQFVIVLTGKVEKVGDCQAFVQSFVCFRNYKRCTTAQSASWSLFAQGTFTKTCGKDRYFFLPIPKSSWFFFRWCDTFCKLSHVF